MDKDREEELCQGVQPNMMNEVKVVAVIPALNARAFSGTMLKSTNPKGRWACPTATWPSIARGLTLGLLINATKSL
jgi:hypothetical protein